MKNIVKKFFEIYSIFLFIFKLKRIVKFNNKLVLLKIFFIRLFFSYPIIRNLNKCKIVSNIENNEFFEDKINSNFIVSNLEKKGFYQKILNKNLTNNIISEIPKLISNIGFKGRKKSVTNVEKFYCKDLFQFKDFTCKKKISHIQLVLDLNRESNFKKFILSSFVKNIAFDYLNTKSISIGARIFISNPIQGGIRDFEKSANAQKFHTDIDYSKHFKIFIYLDDVLDQDGPHIFIPGTHKRKKFSHLLIKRYEDDIIYQNYSEKVKFTGKKGTIFFEDTFGFHKGTTPIENSRIALVVVFGKGKIRYDKDHIILNK